MTAATQQVADHIRDLRAQRRWTQRQLAEACARAAPGTFLTRGTIAKIESGSRKYVTAGEVKVLARVFGVSPSVLLNSAREATMIHVTYDGDTYWLACFADDPDAEHGDVIHPIDAGDSWDEMTAKVAAHRAEHGCATP